jgi:hypothetical protein
MDDPDCVQSADVSVSSDIQLIDHADLFEKIQSLVLIHTSARYAAGEIEKLIVSQLPPALKIKTIVAGR